MNKQRVYVADKRVLGLSQNQPIVQIQLRMHIPLALRGESAASMHFEKVRGAKASSNGRTEYWYAVHLTANIRTVCDVVLSECESPRGEFAPGSI